MAAGDTIRLITPILLWIMYNGIRSSDAACVVPAHFRGDYFSMERGNEYNTIINADMLDNEDFTGQCHDLEVVNGTQDANGNGDSFILFYDSASNCYMCYLLLYRTANIIQYKMSECRSTQSGVPTLTDVCSQILPQTDMSTFFRKTLVTVNCKNTFEGVFHFTYEWNYGGGGICDSPYSQIMACQEPGSPYVDNQVFNMNFGKCPDVATSSNQQIRFQCMGTWTDDTGNVWSGMADIGQEVWRERFRCMLTRYDQEADDNKRYYALSWWAECSTLKSPYEGPVRLKVQPVVGGYQLNYAQPSCNFPTNSSGHWFHWGEYDVGVDINTTHIYFKTKLDQYTFRETYFICMMNSGTRFLTVAVTVGKCEIDFVCFDMLPRHHSVIRWRMGKPYRLTQVEMAYPNFEMYMFRQACTWSSFTVNREVIDWNYKTFLLNPPVPTPCPVRGRYEFTQTGPSSELFRTRIRGVTERPRHMIDCRQYTAEAKSCDDNPSRWLIDAEYCETVDHTGRPIGEYDVPDWEMTCVGFWMEDWKSYMITYDAEDPTSPFRCWNYQRSDWRHIEMSRATGAACRPEQTPTSSEPIEGASLALKLTEAERQFDSCSQNYFNGRDPWHPTNQFGSSRACSMTCCLYLTLSLSLISLCSMWNLFNNNH